MSALGGISSHVLSRLKGIETFLRKKELIRVKESVHTCFPVWRELKQPFEAIKEIALRTGSHVLSRLKGIETLTTSKCSSWSWSCSHVLSRLKGIETFTEVATLHFSICDCSHVLSRLKGIETFACSLNMDFSLCSHVLSRLKGIETF